MWHRAKRRLTQPVTDSARLFLTVSEVGFRISTVFDIWVQTECSCHLGHKCPADVASRYITIEPWLSACMSLGLDGGGGVADKLAAREGWKDERSEERIKRGNEGRPHNKFLRVGLVKLCTGVILLSAGVTEGHQTID